MSKKHTVIVGLDGVPYGLIQHFSENGTMPHMGALIREGAYGRRFSHCEALHERLFVMVSDHSKLAVRQSPLDGTLRIFAESYEADRAVDMVDTVKGMLLV